MRCCILCGSSPASDPKKLSTVRVVHLSGYVEDFEQPVSVSHVAEKPEKQFVCTAGQLVSMKPMRPEAVLEPGQVYFLLPYSALQADMSPLDLAVLARRLTARAYQAGPSNPASPRSSGPSSPARGDDEVAAFAERRPSVKVRSWKPVLDTIGEISFHRKNESELTLHDDVSCLED